MKELPLLFSDPMVIAILSGQKTQTRRVVKPQPYCLPLPAHAPDALNCRLGAFVWNERSPVPPNVAQFSRYGQPGDRLWVREGFYAFGRWETRFSAEKGRDEWHFIDLTLESGRSYSYTADGNHPLPMGGRRNAGATPCWWKRPSIFMPRQACRLVLEIVGVRVERLQDISDEDALQEGVDRTNSSIRGYAKERFKRLWESINGAESWSANSWVWVIEFRRAQA